MIPALALLLLLQSPAPAPVPTAAPTPPIGINLEMLAEYSPSKPFVDLMHLTSAWVPTSPAPTPLATNADGWPIAPASCRTMMTDYPSGAYQLSFAGTGTIAFSGQHAPKLGAVTKGADGISRGAVSLASGPGYLTIAITATTPTDPIRDVHLIHPAYDPTAPPVWTDDYILALRPFACVRTMAATRTNTAGGIVDWSDRPHLGDACWTTGKGIPLEALIDLANQAGKDLWLNVPDQASDDYVWQMAALVRSTLAPGRKVYVEFSNECWNAAFAQNKRISATAALNPLLTGADPNTRASQQAAVRAMQVGRIWRAAWGDQAHRVRMVVGGQCNNTWFAAQGLAYLESIGVDPSAEFFGLAVAPYPSLPVAADVTGLTVDQVFAALEANLQAPTIPGIAANAALARKYGLELLAYEWGPSMPGMNGGVSRNMVVKFSAQDDPRMADLYRSIMSAWSAAGGGLACHYGAPAGLYDQWGTWGLTSHADALAAGSTKWDAMMGMACAPGDLNADGAVDYDDYLRLVDSGGTADDVAAWLALRPRLSDPQRAKIAARLAN